MAHGKFSQVTYFGIVKNLMIGGRLMVYAVITMTFAQDVGTIPPGESFPFLA